MHASAVLPTFPQVDWAQNTNEPTNATPEAASRPRTHSLSPLRALGGTQENVTAVGLQTVW